MTTPDDMERARRVKWREEGFAHEAELPDLPLWASCLLIATFGIAILLASPFWLIEWLRERMRRTQG